MSLLSGLFADLEKIPAPRFENHPIVAPTVKHYEPLAVLTAANDQQQDQPQHSHRTAATAPPEWITARDGYMNHLMRCRACHAPVGRYCATGAELRATYNATPWS